MEQLASNDASEEQKIDAKPQITEDHGNTDTKEAKVEQKKESDVQ